MKNIQRLLPGDFRAVVRVSRLLAIATVELTIALELFRSVVEHALVQRHGSECGDPNHRSSR